MSEIKEDASRAREGLEMFITSRNSFSVKNINNGAFQVRQEILNYLSGSACEGRSNANFYRRIGFGCDPQRNRDCCRQKVLGYWKADMPRHVSFSVNRITVLRNAVIEMALRAG